MGHVEIEKQSELKAGELQVREDLRNVDGEQFFHALHFNDQAFFNDEINAVCRPKCDLLIDDKQMDLVFDMQARLTKFIGEASADSTFRERRLPARCVLGA